MKHRRHLAFAGIVVSACLLMGTIHPAASGETPAVPHLKIGLIKSLLVASNSSISMAAPLGHMLGSQMGCNLQFVQCDDHLDMAKKLQDGEIQLGVIHGIEYSWLKCEAPDIEPLALALSHEIRLQAVLLVRADAPYSSICDLQGKTLLRPTKTLNHNCLFLTKLVRETCPQCDEFFANVRAVGSVDKAIDAVIDGEGDAVVIDSQSWAIYQESKPGRARRAKVLVESGNFPTAAVLHRPGGVDASTLAQIKTGFLNIHQKPIGQQMLVFWRLKKFIPVTPEYHDLCRDILREYPEPIQPAPFTLKK